MEKKNKKIICGKVIKGMLFGRKLNFPTINLAYASLDISFGVYAVKVNVEGNIYRGAMHYGPRSIWGIEEPSLEVHLLDFSGDIYGCEVKIEVFGKIRDVRNFESIESLKRQIRLDVESVRGAMLE